MYVGGCACIHTFRLFLLGRPSSIEMFVAYNVVITTLLVTMRASVVFATMESNVDDEIAYFTVR